MHARPSHEDPLLVALPGGTAPGREIGAWLDSERVHAWHLPAPWAFEPLGVSPQVLLGTERGLTPAALEGALARLDAYCDDARLHALVQQQWAEANETVRDFYLERSLVGTFASIFRMAPRSVEMAPPERFTQDQRLLLAVPLEYRLPGDAEATPRQAPAEEATLVHYPFDPFGETGRRDALGDGPGGVILEAFAYESGRARHREALEAFGAARGWRVVDPREG